MRLVDGTTELLVDVSGSFADKAIRVGGYINHHRIPLSVVCHTNVAVYSTDSPTEAWFRQHVVVPTIKGTSVLVGFVHDSQVYVFYYRDGIKMMVLDWGNLNPQQDSVTKDTKVFDRVIDGRRRKTKAADKVVEAKPLLMEPLISKLVLSGLRIRGINGGSDLAREVYQMTVKAAMLSVRKFNRKVLVPEMQEIVEKLLEIFIDV